MAKELPQKIRVNGHTYVKAADTGITRDELLQRFLEGIRQSKENLKELTFEFDMLEKGARRDPTDLPPEPGYLPVLDSAVARLTGKIDMLKELHKIIQEYEPGKPIPLTDSGMYFSPRS